MSRARIIVAGAIVFVVLALLFAAQITIDARYAGRPLSWPRALTLAFAGWLGWAVLSPIVILIARRSPFTRRGVVVHALASIVLTLIKTGATTALLRAAGWGPREAQWIVNIPVNLAAYWAIAAVTRAVVVQLRASRLEASLSEARLELLLSQIRPHFLFNALHAVSELMHEDVEAADRMVTRLSELLRASLETGGRQMIPLRQELGTVERYLDIERVRFGDRLQMRIDVEPAALDLLVPTFLLQPIVENAVRHASTLIDVRAKAKEMLEIEVRDDGPGFRGESNEGTGLSNVRARVDIAGGSVETRDENGAVVTIRLPRRTS